MRFSKLLFPAIMISMLIGSGQAVSQPHGPARMAAHDAAKKSSKQVSFKYKQVITLFKKKKPHDKRHQAETMESFIESHKAWLRMRDARCATSANLVVYPSGSMLHTQTYMYCISRMNNRYLKHLKRIETEIRHSYKP